MQHSNNKHKQIALNLFASIISFVVNFGISFFLTPFIIVKIGREAYGFVGLAHSFVSYASILTAALNSMAGRFITISLSKEDNEDAARYISSVFAANIVLAVPLTIALSLIIVFIDRLVNIPAEIVTDVRILWAMMFTGFILSLITNVFSVATFAKNRLDIPSRIGVATNLVRVFIILVSFLCFVPAIWYLGLASVVCTIISCVINYYVYKLLLGDIRIKREFIEFKRITKLVASGIWNSISQLCSVLLEELDLLVTNLFVNAASMGTVSIAKSIPNWMLSFFVLFGNAFSPQITIDYAKGDKEALQEDLTSAIRLISFCSSIPLVCLYVFGRDFFSLWLPDQDATQLSIIAVLACLEFPLVVPLEPMWKVFTACNKTRQTAIVAIITAVVSVSTTFGLLYFAEGEFQKMCIIVGVSSCLGLLRGGLFLPLYGAHCIEAKWYTFYPVLGKNILGIGIGVLIAYAYRSLVTIDSWAMLIGSGVLIATIMLCINFFLLLTKKERQTIIHKIHRT